MSTLLSIKVLVPLAVAIAGITALACLQEHRAPPHLTPAERDMAHSVRSVNPGRSDLKLK